MKEFKNLKGEVVDLSSRSNTAKTYGSWLSKTAKPSQIVDWCNDRIAKYAEWSKECECLKAQCQSDQAVDMPVNVRLHGMTKEEIQDYLKTLE